MVLVWRIKDDSPNLPKFLPAKLCHYTVRIYANAQRMQLRIKFNDFVCIYASSCDNLTLVTMLFVHCSNVQYYQYIDYRDIIFHCYVIVVTQYEYDIFVINRVPGEAEDKC